MNNIELTVTVWNIWKVSNMRIFQKKERSPSDVYNQALTDLRIAFKRICEKYLTTSRGQAAIATGVEDHETEREKIPSTRYDHVLP